jgi:DNA-binding NarL/FixJ family response regulator
VKVVVLTTFSRRSLVLAAMQAGAVGYLLKDDDVSQLLRGLRAAARGEAPLDPRAAREMVPARGFGGSEAQPPPAPSLTDREWDVLALVAEGLSNKDISARLGISQGTVKSHLRAAFQRIGVNDRTSAAMWVRDHPQPSAGQNLQPHNDS